MALLRTFMHFRAFKYTFMTFLSGFSEIIKDGTDLASGEILAMGVIAGALQLLAELGNAVDPTHQVAGGSARVAGGEIEHCKLLFAITSYFHFLLKNKIKNITSIILSFSNHPVPLSKEGSTAFPKPFSPQGTRDVAGDAIALPEFWYRQRSLCPKGLPMIFYAIELRLFVRCYTALLRACLLVAGGGIGLFALAVVALNFYRWEIGVLRLRDTFFFKGVTRANAEGLLMDSSLFVLLSSLNQ